MKDWRKPVGMVPFGIWMGLYYAGSFFDYWDVFIFQAGVVAATAYFFAYYWSKFYRKNNKQTDAAYYKASRKDLLVAHQWALENMSLQYPRDYLNRWADCDDFAEEVCVWMKAWFRIHYTFKGQGLAIAPFGYDKDKGGGHVCVEALSDDGSVFLEVYQGYGELTLSKKEKRSAQWRNF